RERRLMSMFHLLLVLSVLVLAGVPMLALPAALSPPGTTAALGQAIDNAPVACTALGSVSQIPAPTIVTFDDLPDGANIANFYVAGAGVRFEDSRAARAIAATDRLARSAPNV